MPPHGDIEPNQQPAKTDSLKVPRQTSMSVGLSFHLAGAGFLDMKKFELVPLGCKGHVGISKEDLHPALVEQLCCRQCGSEHHVKHYLLIRLACFYELAQKPSRL